MRRIPKTLWNGKVRTSTLILPLPLELIGPLVGGGRFGRDTS